MPNATEAGYKNYKQFGSYFVLSLNYSKGSIVSIDIKKRFTNLFPK
jgi:hypothetical protein